MVSSFQMTQLCKSRWDASRISHGLPSTITTQASRHEWCMIINYYKATRHYQLPPQQKSKPNPNPPQLSSRKRVKVKEVENS
jgi:hypothetical protein